MPDTDETEPCDPRNASQPITVEPKTFRMVRLVGLTAYPQAALPVDLTRPLAIVLQDCSTSQRFSREHVPAASAAMRDALARSLGAHTQLVHLGVHSTIFPLVEGVVGPNAMRVLTADDLQRKEAGGILEGGSALSNAFLFGAEIALTLRRAGYTQPIALVLICDGDNRQHRREPSEQLARHALTAARQSDVSVLLAGYVPEQYRASMARFIGALGLHPDEIRISYEGGAAAVEKTFREATQRIRDVTGPLGPPRTNPAEGEGFF